MYENPPKRPRTKIIIADESKPTPTLTIDKTTLHTLLNEMPELQMAPTDRYYGEVYYPKMQVWLARLKALAE